VRRRVVHDHRAVLAHDVVDGASLEPAFDVKAADEVARRLEGDPNHEPDRAALRAADLLAKPAHRDDQPSHDCRTRRHAVGPEVRVRVELEVELEAFRAVIL
jgi:hypothetical protein